MRRSRPRGDVQRMLAAIAKTAGRLCEANDAVILLVEGDQARLVARHGRLGVPRKMGEALPLSVDMISHRAIVECRTIHIRDLAKTPRARFLMSKARLLPLGVRTVLATPLLRDGAAIGAFVIRRTKVRPFTPSQIALLTTLADQAAIAIENARLSQALVARNADLTEALEQQTATSDILRVISSSPTDIRPVLETVVRAAARFCGAVNVAIMRLDGGVLRGAATVGPFGDAMILRVGSIEGLEVPVTRGSVTGRALLERRTVHVHDLAAEPPDEFPVGRELQLQFGHRTLVATPLLREGAPLGVIVMFRTEVKPFSDKQLTLLRTFADQAVIAIENVRLFTELEARNADLTEALEQQTATAEILRVISSSPTDVQPVFAAILEQAAGLCGAQQALLWLHEGGEQFRLGAAHGTRPEYRSWLSGQLHFFGRPFFRPDGPWRVGHIEDVRETQPYRRGDPLWVRTADEEGMRTMLGVPLVKEGRLLGSIAVYRREVQPFTDAHIALIRTFAEQAGIAIENVRLFTELEARNSELKVALEQQTATSELLKVIGRSTFDLQPVFETLAENAVRLCEAERAFIWRPDGEVLRAVVMHNATAVLRDFAERNPIVPGRSSGAARAAAERRTVHIPDALADPDYSFGARAVDPIRTVLAMPMLRANELLGVIAIYRLDVRPFTDSQIALLETFADQAAIAIENARLLGELQAKNTDLTEALEQQTATSKILQVISSSPTDAQPVFDIIAESAVELCGAEVGLVTRFDGVLVDVKAVYGTSAEGRDAIRRVYPMPPSGAATSARAIRDCAIAHIPDVLADEGYGIPESAIASGFRAALSVPMLREARAIGSITIGRAAPGEFSGAQIKLLCTFADQAVIAIENVRLFKELEARNRDLTEALEQQTATSEILRVISSSQTDVQPVFDTIVRSAVKLCDGLFSALFRFDGELLHFVSQYNFTPEALESERRVFPAPPNRGQGAARAILERAVVHIPDVDADLEYRQHAVARAIGFRSGLFVPMLREGAPVGVIMVARAAPGPFSDSEIELLKTFADQAVIAIENVRLFKELEARNRDLTATSEILQVISRSPTDVQPVFDRIADRAMRLCDAAIGAVFMFDGTLIHLNAVANVSPEGADALRQAFPLAPSRASMAGRVILTGNVVEIPDVLSDPEYQLIGAAQVARYRCNLGVPMLHQGRAIGVIIVTRPEPGTFLDEQIQLLRTFADQAVIAVENARLFKELEARTGELTQSVEKLTALSDVSQALSSTLDVETVLDTIVSHASQLSGGAGCAIYEYDEAAEQFELRATHGYDAEFVVALGASPLRKGEGLMGRAAEVREAMQVPDITQPGAYQSSVRDTLNRFGYRAILSVPLLREELIIGSLSLTRKAPGEYPPEVIEVLKTFATQSALAIQNTRLFREIADKSRQLEVASRHKSEFLANMSHELRTPLNAIIGFSEVLNERMFGELNEKQDEYLKDIHASGQHLLSLINDILDLSKIEAGRMELELTDFDLPMAIDNALTLVRERASRRGVALKLTVGEGVGTVRGDERKMKQVLLNLLSNAIKFTPEGGRIKVGASLVDGAVEVSISDTGVGIAPEDLEAVFEEFRQVGASAAKQEGTGLGLALCRKFIELHGGTIRVESAIGAGSTFTFRLPARG